MISDRSSGSRVRPAASALAQSGNARWCRAGVIILQVATALMLRADTTRTQTIQLQQGWNAVFLEVSPSNSAAAVVFGDTPIDIVASYQGKSSPAQFMSHPAADLFRDAGWGVWYAQKRPDAFLKTLHAIYGQQPYLIHSKADFTWNLSGTVNPPEIRWQADAYNLVGFSVRTSGAPTFAQFFAASSAHRHNKLYRLTGGTWRRVLDPSAEAMRSGEAFWVYCEGNSKYQGPLSVETATRYGVFLSTGTDAVTLRNQTDHPITPMLEHVPSGSAGLPLSILIQAVGDPTAPVQSIAAPQPAGAWTQPLPPLEAGQGVKVPLEIRREEAAAFAQSALLKISTDLGTEVWLPVIGVRKDLEEQ